MRKQLKKRSDSKLAQLSPAQKALLAHWLLHGVPTETGGLSSSYAAVILHVKKEMGVQVGKSALSDYFREEVSPGERKVAASATDRVMMAGAIRAVRAYQGVSPDQLADRAGLALLELDLIEAGEAACPPTTMRAIESALNVPPGFFFRIASAGDSLFARAPQAPCGRSASEPARA
jgi:hypothetical protein